MLRAEFLEFMDDDELVAEFHKAGLYLDGEPRQPVVGTGSLTKVIAWEYLKIRNDFHATPDFSVFNGDDLSRPQNT